MYPDTITRYVEAISHTRKGLKVLIADDWPIEQLAFIETVREYLPESTAEAVDQRGLDAVLNHSQQTYDLIVLEERLVLQQPDEWYAQQLRAKYPDAKIALFIDRENLHQLQTVSQLPVIDIILTKCSSVEAIAEKFCLTFQEVR